MISCKSWIMAWLRALFVNHAPCHGFPRLRALFVCAEVLWRHVIPLIQVEPSSGIGYSRPRFFRDERARVRLHRALPLPLHHAVQDRHRPSPVFARRPLALSAIRHASAVHSVIRRGVQWVPMGFSSGSLLGPSYSFHPSPFFDQAL